MRKNRHSQFLMVFCEIGYILLISLSLIGLIYGYRHGFVTAGDFAFVIPLAMSSADLTWGLANSLAGITQAMGSIKNGLKTLDQPSFVNDKANAVPFRMTEASIVIRNMCFSYGAHEVFRDFNLEIAAGEKIGLVGASGAGKSTLIQLLLRFYDIQSGEILMSGQNIAKIQQETLREQISIIPQSTDLLHRSLKHNIRYGQPGATEEEVVDAAKRAHAHEFIMEMEDKDGNKGYEALVGERGVKLSGGQRQRIAIARAVLKKTPVLILDEATSALDSESERLIQESLKDLMQDKTVIAIAHRLSTIAHLDRLIILEEGRIVEEGSHEDLLKRDGLYARLWRMQSNGFIVT